tara:strand:+ start:105 stop:773 length:669 start_codon:yes stop_codon:yes gene_type:complete
MRQKYENVPLFPVRCFNFKASSSLVEDTLEKVKKLDYRSYNEPEGVGTSNDIHTNPEFRGLHDWFQKCIDTLHVDNGWQADRIVVNKSWVNRSDANTGHHHDPHRHPMSYLSGIFYLTEGPPTVFLDPLAQREWAQLHLDGGPARDCRQFIHSGAGGCFIFPSYMIHSSVENYEDVDRYSIAFNTFPQGNLNSGGWEQPMVTVDVTSGWSQLGPLNLSDYAR